VKYIIVHFVQQPWRARMVFCILSHQK